MGKKWLLLFSAVLLAMGLLAGCSGGGGSEDTMLQDPAVDGGVTEEPATEPETEAPEGDAGTDATTEEAPAETTTE